MSDLDWNGRLHHIRWNRLVLFMEKWFSLLILGFFFLLDFQPVSVVALALILLFMYVLAHNHYYSLEGAAGLPSNQIIVRY